jgi:3-phosphoshikimate 1-carboxyvinyltransferase
MSFHFSGAIPASKSIYNRALLVQSFFPDLKIVGQSSCDDVRAMKLAIVSMIKRLEIDCGEAGTVFRFMGMRVSRESGAFHLKGSKRLMQRPQEELAFILNQLNVNVDFVPDGVLIRSEGWKRPLFPVKIPRARSSQFASGLLLSAWELPFDLEVEVAGTGISEGYWQMSLIMARQLGMEVTVDQDKILIPARQKLQVKSLDVEPDYSSMFSVVAAALIGGDVEIQNVGHQSLQPDYAFFDQLKKMGVPLSVNREGHLKVSAAKQLSPLSASFRQCPDLFPVMAALCGFATGTSRLVEAPQLAHKESHRLHKTQELLKLAGIESVIKNEGLEIHGEGPGFKPHEFVFDPDQDHRMAMAAALFKLREAKVRIQSPEVVKKSFPEFWSVVGLA